MKKLLSLLAAFGMSATTAATAATVVACGNDKKDDNKKPETDKPLLNDDNVKLTEEGAKQPELTSFADNAKKIINNGTKLNATASIPRAAAELIVMSRKDNSELQKIKYVVGLPTLSAPSGLEGWKGADNNAKSTVFRIADYVADASYANEETITPDKLENVAKFDHVNEGDGILIVSPADKNGGNNTDMPLVWTMEKGLKLQYNITRGRAKPETPETLATKDEAEAPKKATDFEGVNDATNLTIDYSKDTVQKTKITDFINQDALKEVDLVDEDGQNVGVGLSIYNHFFNDKMSDKPKTQSVLIKKILGENALKATDPNEDATKAAQRADLEYFFKKIFEAINDQNGTENQNVKDLLVSINITKEGVEDKDGVLSVAKGAKLTLNIEPKEDSTLGDFFDVDNSIGAFTLKTTEKA